MDTKWKKFSRSMPVRVVLNVLLIVSIVLGGFAVNTVSKYDLAANRYQSKVYDEDELYGNSDLIDEVQDNLQEVLNYTLQTVCLKNNENNKEFLVKAKKELDEKCKNYSYRISYTGDKGKQTVISNTKDEEETIAASSLYVNYKGVKTEEGYVKGWTNKYKNQNTEFEWLAVNRLINENCDHSAKYASFIANQLYTNLALYKNDLVDSLYYLAEGKYENICEKIYGKDFLEDYDPDYYDDYDDYYDDFEAEEDEDEENTTSEDSKKETSEKSAKTTDKENPYGLTEEEQEKLKTIIETTVLSGGDSGDAEINIPISAMLGSPNEYSISFGMKQSYFDEVQTKYNEEVKQNEKKAAALFEKSEEAAYVFFYICAAFCVIVLALLYVCGRKYGTEEVQYLVIDRLYTEVQIFLECIFFFGVMLYGSLVSEGMVNGGIDMRSITLLFIPCVSAWLMVQFLCSIVRKAKGKKIYENSILCKIVNGIRKVMNSGKGTLISVLLVVILPGIWGMIALLSSMVLYDSGDDDVFIIATLLYLVGWVVLVIFVYRFSSMFEKICDGVKRVKDGDIKHQIATNGKKTRLNELAENINSLSDGLENAVSEMTKSERLKTELISNVSHDIKTPLTSIITYVDLIKKEDVQPEKAKEYIEVLDQKSQRLKALTDDLFEAAKASSGAMSMDIETLDVGSFVSQGIGEFAEKFEKSNLDVKSNVEKEMHYVKADGRLLWRIFENILTNVSKYALPGSRVYVDVEKQAGNVILTVKNISAVELNISAEELMERFTRGDSSRNTEGSGLGLNIANSLAELQGGSFHVEIDGDLFKSVLVLPETDCK